MQPHLYMATWFNVTTAAYIMKNGSKMTKCDSNTPSMILNEYLYYYIIKARNSLQTLKMNLIILIVIIVIIVKSVCKSESYDVVGYHAAKAK